MYFKQSIEFMYIDDIKLRHFCDKIGYEHTYSKKLISYIRGKISSYMKESLYRNINSDLVDNLKQTPHTIYVKSNGIQHYILMTKFNKKRICVVFDKNFANGVYIIRMRFNPFTYNDTLIDGELIKDNNSMWIFLISDMYILNGQFTGKHIYERYNKIYQMLTTSYKKDKILDPFVFQVKRLFKYSDIPKLNQFIEKLSYPIKTIIFKSLYINNQSYGIPYTSTDYSNINAPLSNTTQYPSNTKSYSSYPSNTKSYSSYPSNTKSYSSYPSNTKSYQSKQEYNDDIASKLSEDEMSDVQSVSDITVESDELVTRQPELVVQIKEDRDFKKASIMLKKTMLPDVYSIMVVNDESKENELKHHCYACINTMKVSKWTNSLFTTNDTAKVICKYHTRFKKWIPDEKSSDDLVTMKIIKELEN